MKTAILIHGHHLEDKSWKDIVWGNPNGGLLGRVPRGLIEALRLDAEIIFFPTGASQKDNLKEGEYTLSFTREHLMEIPEMARMGTDALEWLNARAVLELSSQNTKTEIEACAHIARERGIEQLVLVSSPTHIMRAHRDALSLVAGGGDTAAFAHSLSAVASDVSYAESTVDDVIILEPPHRPDRPKIYFNQTLKPLIALMNSKNAQELNRALQDLIEKFRITNQ